MAVSQLNASERFGYHHSFLVFVPEGDSIMVVWQGPANEKTQELLYWPLWLWRYDNIRILAKVQSNNFTCVAKFQ